MFMVVIQFGSILAVVVLYFNKLNPFSTKKTPEQKSDTVSLWIKVLIAVIPAGVIGLLFEEQIDRLFYNPPTIAITLIVYGVLFIVMERRKRTPTIESFTALTWKTALLIGVFQMLALIPGTSRSGATILGAVLLGASRTVASEFSFFLAIPVMLGASGLKLIKGGLSYSASEWTVLLVGCIMAFLVSIVAIRFLLGYIRKHDFQIFGYYRIILGVVVLLAMFL